MKFLGTAFYALIFTLLSSTAGMAQSGLAKQLDQLEEYISRRDRIAPEVSAVNVAWHLDHALKLVMGIYMTLEASDPEEYAYTFKPVRTLVLKTGWMPRGVGKAPKSVLPPDEVTLEALEKQLRVARSLLGRFEQLERKQFFNHPVFGALNRNRTTKFVRIHTRHHMKIVRDILKAEEAR